MERTRKAHLHLALLGGGVWIAELVEALARSRQLPSMTLRIAARDQERLRIIVRHCQIVATSIREDCVVVGSGSLQAAVEGTDAVLCMIRVGGSRARMLDETFPTRFASPGDEGLGCGGMANACRSVPVVEQLCRAIRAHAPRAKIFNLMAPLGVTTRVFLDHALDAVGVCELPTVTEKRLGENRSAPASASASAPEYGGFNHLGWFWTQSRAASASLEEAAISANLADVNTLRRFQALPLWYYYKLFDPAAGASLGLATNCHGRAEQLSRLADSIMRDFHADPGGTAPALRQRAMNWWHEALVPVLEGAFGAARYEGFLNLRNEGLLSQLPHDAVVEVRASISGEQTTARGCQAIPREVLQFLQGIARAEEHTYFAARATSPKEKLERLGRAVDSLRDIGLPIAARSTNEVAAEIVRSADAVDRQSAT